MHQTQQFHDKLCLSVYSHVLFLSFAMKTSFYLMLVLLLILPPLTSGAQRFSVSGKVTDEFTHMPVSQVNVVDVRSSIGTITNEDGSYFLMLNKGPVEMQYGGISHQPVKLSFELKQDTIIDIRLLLSAEERSRRLKREGMKTAPVTEVTPPSSSDKH